MNRRTDKPDYGCIVDGDKQKWYKHGKLHRDDGPAFVNPGLLEGWYQHGKLHRTDGPAVMYGEIHGNINLWFVDGQEVHTKQRYQELAKISNEELLILIIKYGEIR